MKIFSFLLLLLTAFSMHALQVVDLGTGSITTDSVLAAPERNVEYTDDGIIVTYKFRNIGIEEDDIYTGTYRLELPGFIIGNEPGLPALPSGQDSFVVPPYSEPQVSLLHSAYIEIKQMVAPGRESKFMNDTIPYSLNSVLPIVPYVGLWPQRICEDLGSYIYREKLIANIAVNPVQYDYSTQTVRAYTEISYYIAFKDGVRMSDIYYEPGSLLNPDCPIDANETIKGEYSTERVPGSSIKADAGYLIISVPEFELTLQEFIKWKRQMGYSVTALYDANWDTEKIFSAIKTRYEVDKTLMYILFVGDHNLVPAKIVNDEKVPITIISDFPYGCMNGPRDSAADIYRGRWPVSNTYDLETIIDKTIWYEQAPPLDYDKFYRRAVHFSFFEDGSKMGYHDGTEDSRFVKTSEDVRDYLMQNHYFNIKRVYSKSSGKYEFEHWPLRWSVLYSYGKDVPLDLNHQLGYDWDGKTSDLVDAVNDGVSYLLFSGHGSGSAWGNGYEDLFTASDINKMCNFERLPIIFSICCMTGNHEENNCLVNSFLSKKNGGAVAAFAATNNSLYSTHGLTAGLFFHAIWLDPGFRMEKCEITTFIIEPEDIKSGGYRQLGAILDYAMLNARSADEKNYMCNLFHCFGDPSLYYYAKPPTRIGNIEVNRTMTGVNVYTKGQKAFIGIYDPTTNKSARFFGTEASFFSDTEKGGKYLDVVVYKPNSVPYINKGLEYDAGDTDTSLSSRIINYKDKYDGSRVELEYYLSSRDANKKVEIYLIDIYTSNVISSLTVDKTITDCNTFVNVRTNGGVVMASLMIDGYPVSNMKMYLSK